MSQPANPNWALGYVPSAAEWNSWFGDKADFPVPVSQGGTGGQTAAAGCYGLLLRSLIAATGTVAVPLTHYGVRTSVGALTMTLPALSSLQPGDWISFFDVDFAAQTHGFLITATGADQIVWNGSAAPSQVMSDNGFAVTLIANVGAWSLMSMNGSSDMSSIVQPAYSPPAPYTPGTAFDARAYGSVTLAITTAASTAWAPKWSPDNVNWLPVSGIDLNFNMQSVVGAGYLGAITYDGGGYFQITGGNGGAFQISAGQ